MCMVQLRYIFDSNCTVEYGCNCIINIRIERKSRAHVFQLYINSVKAFDSGDGVYNTVITVIYSIVLSINY